MRYKFKQILVLLAFTLVVQLVSAAEYKVVVRAIRGIDFAYKQWQPTLDYLSAKTAHSFVLKPILSLNEITKIAANKNADFILTNPSSFVEIQQLHAAKALATLNNKRAGTAQEKFGSVIFTHAQNKNIFSIQDLENKVLMAVSEPAFGGWRVAWLEMLEQGFDPYSKLQKIEFSRNKTQPEVVQAVLDRKVDAGVVRTDMLERLEAAGKLDMRYLRVLNNINVKGFPFFLSTKLYPEWAFASLRHVPEKDADQVTEVLMQINQNQNAAKSGKYIGWIRPHDYQDVKNLMVRLKVGPYKK